ncbi:Uncharacterized MFS-type transporter YybF [[Clostridium] ultunense Esp]|nr:Uncharacterized MFS-type transporter YybF [[Clostridium] ultunense Esp]
MSYIEKGTPDFWKASTALFAGGFVTFSTLYYTQPLLPVFAERFHVSPAVASLSLSLSTTALAFAMLGIAPLSERVGRKPVMAFALFASSLVALLSAFTPNFTSLLVLRVLQGIVLAGLPAIAMAYVGEEFHPYSLGAAMGLYVSGTSIGGMSGRIITGMVTDYFSWQAAVVTIGMISILCSLYFLYGLPNSLHFKPHPMSLRQMGFSFLHHLRTPTLLSLFIISFFLMGSFVTLYNYIGFLLMKPPYNLSQTAMGWIFIVYLVGTFSAVWMGRLADRHGRGITLALSLLLMLVGALLTLLPVLWVILFGLALFTFGFFAGHAVASGWVGKIAVVDKAQASSLYLLFYYVGSGLMGSTGGILLSLFHWVGIILFISAAQISALLLNGYLYFFEKKKKAIET